MLLLSVINDDIITSLDPIKIRLEVNVTVKGQCVCTLNNIMIMFYHYKSEDKLKVRIKDESSVII